MITTGLKLNTKLIAPTQLAGCNFNSLCYFNGALIGSNENGVFVEGGDLDNTTEILSFFKTFSTDFNDIHIKNVREIEISGVFKTIKAAIVADNVEKTDYYGLKDSSLKQKTITLRTSHDDSGKYLGVRITNVDGSDFSIDQISLVVGATHKFKYNDAVVGRTSVTLPMLTDGNMTLPMITLESSGG